MNINNIEEIINVLLEDPKYVEKLTDEQVDYLINYLKNEIKNQEEILSNLENHVES